MTKRVRVFGYGIVAYALVFGPFVYALAFTGNFFAPKPIDSARLAPFLETLLVNLLLLGAFAVASIGYVLAVLRLEQNGPIGTNDRRYVNSRREVTLPVPWTRRRAPGIAPGLPKAA